MTTTNEALNAFIDRTAAFARNIDPSQRVEIVLPATELLAVVIACEKYVKRPRS